MVERFAKERSRETKGSKFGLGDEDMDGDDLLTHGGKALRLGAAFICVHINFCFQYGSCTFVVVNPP